MTWASDCELMAGDSNDAFGQSVTYEDGVTAATVLTCPVTRERRERRQSQTMGTMWVRIRKIYVDQSEQAVRHDGKFTVDGIQYVVESLENSESGARTIANVQRVAMEEITRPGYRG